MDQSKKIMFRSLIGQSLVMVSMLIAQPLAAGDLADVKARGKLTLVCFLNVDLPFVQVNLDVMQERNLKLSDVHRLDELRGLDIDLMKGFAKSLGVGLEIRPFTQTFSDLIPALLRREGDLIASSLTITPQRRELVGFSDSYFEGAETIVVRADVKASSPADLAGKKCVAGRGTSQLETMKTLIPGVQISEVDVPFQSYVELDEGRADCAVAETGVAVGDTLKLPYPPLKVAFELRRYQYGVAFRKGSDLEAPLNAYLEGLKRSGELQRLADLYKLSALGRITPACSVAASPQ